MTHPIYTSPPPSYRSSNDRGYGSTNHDNERASLTGTAEHQGITGKQVLRTLCWLVIYTFLLFVFILLFLGIISSILYFVNYNNPLEPAVRERIRRSWEREVAAHKAYNKQLDEERARNIAEEDRQIEFRRAKETREHDQMLRAHQVAVERELNLRRETVAKKEQALRDDEDRRAHAVLRWEDLQPDTSNGCAGYESRLYTAELVNIPRNVDWLSWCLKAPMILREKSYLPTDCSKDRDDRVIAQFKSDFNEPTCKTYWVQHEKQGCHGYHKRIVSAKLWNFKNYNWNNWEAMCWETPSHFNGIHRDHPDLCEWRGRDIIATWFIPDDECPA